MIGSDKRSGLIKLVANAQTDRILGAHILGEFAGEVWVERCLSIPQQAVTSGQFDLDDVAPCEDRSYCEPKLRVDLLWHRDVGQMKLTNPPPGGRFE